MARIEKRSDISGLIPLDDLSPNERNSVQEAASITARNTAADINRVNPMEIAVRHVVMGDSSSATDFVDLNIKTAAVSGQQHWTYAAADLTAGDLSSILNSGESVDDNKAIVFYGFKDYSEEKDLTAIEFNRGSDTLGFWSTEHCYGEEDGGIAPELIVYEQNDPIDIKVNHRGGSKDKNVVLLAYIGEKYGEHVSQP